MTRSRDIKMTEKKGEPRQTMTEPDLSSQRDMASQECVVLTQICISFSQIKQCITFFRVGI